jgi:asparagine synthase (glutamine-hydrolysing)
VSRIFVRAGENHEHDAPADAEAAGWRVVADATLYYQADLRSRIGSAALRPAELIAQYIAKDAQRALDWLEGDYAFVAWKRDSGEIIAARDFTGKRPLFYAIVPNGLLLASDVPALLADPTVDRSVDLARVAAVAAGLWAHGSATAYRGIHEVPAGSVLRWRPGSSVRITPHWKTPEHLEARRQPLDDAAAELRALLDAAVRERLAQDGRTAVSLSGGWDSTAVYGTAKALGADVHGVSVSYPEGDPGREDEFIREVTAFWKTTPDFLDVDEIPLASDWTAEAAVRPLPFAHAYEHWNRTIAARARASGASILLDGVGGDQLFQCGDIFLADLLRGGQWLEALQQVRRPDHSHDWTRLKTWGVDPLLPRWWRVRRARRQNRVFTEDYLERLPPRWFRHGFLREHDVLQVERRNRPLRRASSYVLAEGQAYIEFAFFPRVFALLSGFVADAGLELRSPLLDQRLVRFALQRPWSDRVDGAETKNLLRRAMRGRLPDSVLAPRPHRTGTTNGYFLRRLRADAWPVARTHFSTLRLGELGIVDPHELERAWQHLLQHEDGELAARLFFTFATELWLRSHLP